MGLCAPATVQARALERADAQVLDWRETAAIEHQDRVNRMRRLGLGRLGIAPEITEDVIPAADLPRDIGVDLPVARVVFSESVFFDTDSAELTAEGRAVARVVAEALRREASDTAAFVAGHTDARADDAYNYGLSVRRAGSVAGALFAAGVKQARIWRVGFGEALPRQPNDSPERMAANRRVEFLFARKAEAASLWLARQPATLCPRGQSCERALALLPRVVAQPVTRAAPPVDDVFIRPGRDDVGRGSSDVTGAVLPRVRVETLPPLTPARLDVRPAAPRTDEVRRGAPERADVVIRREDPVVIDLREERVFVGRPQR